MEMDLKKRLIYSVLIGLYLYAFVTSSPVHEKNQNAEKETHYIPTLKELQSGIGIGDPTSEFAPVIKLIDGHIKEQSREEIEQFRIHYDPEMYLEGEDIMQSQAAYNQMVHALAEGDQKRAARAQELAKPFMEKTGLTAETAKEEALSLRARDGDREKRVISASARTSRKWDKCIIPYEFAYFNDPKSNVEDPMRKYETYTGFRFVEWNESTQALYGLSHNNRIRFVSGNGCYSASVGNSRGTGQTVSCCSGSTCVHEIGHALGFQHEQKSPIRDDYVRIDWNQIDTRRWSQYYIYSKQYAEMFGYYDLTSVMHYWNGAFGVNYKRTMTVLDPDQDYLMTRDTDRYYYFFQEAMDTHQCFELFCPEELVCENGGYPSVVRGDCACICPIGLDPKTRCTTHETFETQNDLPWPAGSFTTLNTVDGCPEGFKLGWQFHKTPAYVWGSTPYHASPPWNWWHVEHEFCSRIDEVNDGPEWPQGNYCIFRKGGSCPSGFESGYIQMDDAPTSRTNITEGELPDGVYGANTRWEFCCRNDYDGTVEFPNKHPFILFYYGSNCMDIKGMGSSVQYFTWRSDTADNYNKISGAVPYRYEFSETLYNVYFCYYFPINRDCGGIYNLDSTPLNIRSMNYPNSYDSNIDCIYTILAPENKVIQIDFNAFEIDCDADYLEIARALPGQKGEFYCGSGFKHTFISSNNYMRLRLKSSNRASGTNQPFRFDATVKLKEDPYECLTNRGKDRSYSDNISYTKNFEICLPWNEVQNCKYHRFAPETFDDDLTENYCRFTGVGTGPWCYTNAETCARDYCDTCSMRNCYDLFLDCSDLIAADVNFCSTNLDGQALRGCRKSCGFCQIAESESTCQRPPMVDGISPSPVKNVYTVGDQVEYVCPTENSKDVRTRTCTSSGTWTDLNFVCGACPMGWGLVDGKCYKWFNEHMSREKARVYCENLGATLPTTTTQKQLDYIMKIVDLEKVQMQDVWLGMSKVNGQFQWDDGTDLDFLGWGPSEPTSYGDCAVIDWYGWGSMSCSREESVVCMHSPSERTVCADQSNNCEAYIRATPDLCVRQKDFAFANCPYSCGLCKNDVISVQIGKRSICYDVDNNCQALVKSTDDFCEMHTQFAYTHCQFTCNMCNMPPISIDEETYLEDIEKRWGNSGFMLRQPEKRSFDDCIEPTTSESTTSTTESTTSTTDSTTSTTESTTSTTESTTSTTESTTSTTESTTSTTESTTSSTTEEPTSTTGSPPVQDCDPGVQPAYTELLSVGDDVGQIYEYRCANGYALASGDLIRACLVTGELTGSSPVCLDKSEVELSVNDVNIRRRDRILFDSYTYTAINDDFIITKAGKLTKWRFYSSLTGDVHLQVWRFADNDMTRGTLIGSNFVSETGDDRIRTIEIPQSEQITVQVGDVIAFQQSSDNPAHIAYTRCDLAYEPKQNNQLRSESEKIPSTGSQYSFRNSSYNCKTFSLNAFIK